jgi:hypothetical protein
MRQRAEFGKRPRAVNVLSPEREVVSMGGESDPSPLSGDFGASARKFGRNRN